MRWHGWRDRLSGMSNTDSRQVSRRAVLGAAAVAATGAVLVAPSAAYASHKSASRPVDQDSVDVIASRLDRDLIELRRDIHQHPELSGQEHRTAHAVALRLRAAGLDVATGVGGYGVVGVLTGAHPGRTVAYRADMDATTSRAGETAHLCGHDIHTTVGVGVAQVLARLRHRLAGTVVFIFQPAEESLAGAAAMLDAGVFARTRPAEIHALHCAPFPVGKFAITAGFGLPGLDRGTITVVGAEAIARAQQLAAEIGARGTVSPPASGDDLERLVTDLQTPDGPLAEFVFMQAQAAGTPDRADIELSYRCWPEERYFGIRNDLRRLAGAYAGTTVTFQGDPFPAMVSPEREGMALRRHLQQTFGRDSAIRLYAAIPFFGEDFALFLDRVPGTFTLLGVRAPGTLIEASFPHMDAFAPDERAIGHGVRAMAGWLARRTWI